MSPVFFLVKGSHIGQVNLPHLVRLAGVHRAAASLLRVRQHLLVRLHLQRFVRKFAYLRFAHCFRGVRLSLDKQRRKSVDPRDPARARQLVHHCFARIFHWPRRRFFQNTRRPTSTHLFNTKIVDTGCPRRCDQEMRQSPEGVHVAGTGTRADVHSPVQRSALRFVDCHCVAKCDALGCLLVRQGNCFSPF